MTVRMSMKLRDLNGTEVVRYPKLQRAPIGPGPQIFDGESLLVLTDVSGVWVLVRAERQWYHWPVACASLHLNQAVSNEKADRVPPVVTGEELRWQYGFVPVAIECAPVLLA